MSGWAQRISDRNHDVERAGRWRSLRPLDGGGPAYTTVEGTPVVSFATNDYLGLSQHPAVRAASRTRRVPLTLMS